MSDYVQTSLYDAYDNFYSTRIPPARLGGINRSKTARRDSLGRFQPRNGDLQPDPQHGKPGGRAVVQKYGREHMSRLGKRGAFKRMLEE